MISLGCVVKMYYMSVNMDSFLFRKLLYYRKACPVLKCCIIENHKAKKDRIKSR